MILTLETRLKDSVKDTPVMLRKVTGCSNSWEIKKNDSIDI